MKRSRSWTGDLEKKVDEEVRRSKIMIRRSVRTMLRMIRSTRKMTRGRRRARSRITR